eukprot:GHVU01227841.1.p1 GENE.GHVU01227841.1~~GHVU01227841.1.p1  ORF type:complete len:107 (-),score=5.83 GHVU01227841.1:427-747(-)
MNPSRVAIDHLRTAALAAQSASCTHNLSMLLHHHHAYTHTHTHVDAHMRKYTRMGADTTTHTYATAATLSCFSSPSPSFFQSSCIYRFSNVSASSQAIDPEIASWT